MRLSKKKLLIIAPVILLGLGYFFFLRGGGEAAPKTTKVELAKEFVVNLDDGSFAKFTAALEMDAEDPHVVIEDHSATLGPEYVTAVRGAITDRLTGTDHMDLIDRDRRRRLLKSLAKQIEKDAHLKVHRVFFTDIVVD